MNRVKNCVNLQRQICLIHSRYYSADVGKSIPNQLVIPRRIHRTKTELLEALADTVRKDPTAAHYIYHDDPYLTPLSPFHSREYALSKESGKKAARYVVDTWSQHFKTTPFHTEPQPPIPAFMPTESQVFKITDLGEEGLIERIDRLAVEEALLFYQACKESNIPISENIKLNLLQLTCFYNSSDPNVISDIKRRFASDKETYENGSEQGSSWKMSGPAEQLFHDLEEKSTDACNVMMAGMIKHQAPADSVYTFYTEMLEKGMKPSVRTYNLLLKLIPVLEDYHEERWKMVLDITDAMNNNDIAPTLETFNAMHKILSISGASLVVKQRAMSLMAEMKRCNIQPGLTVYNHLLSTCYKLRANKQSDDSSVGILYSIVSGLKGKDLELSDKDDTYFLPAAMRTNYVILQDLYLAYELMSIAEYGNNEKFLFAQRRDGTFYTFFFLLLAELESVEKVFAAYNRYVPTIYIPNPRVMSAIVKTVEVHEEWDYLPQLWADVRLFRFHPDDVDKLFIDLLRLMAADSRKIDTINKQYKKIAADALTFIEGTLDKQNYNIRFMASLMLLLLKLEDLDSAFSLYKLYSNNREHLPHVALADTLGDFCLQLIDDGEIEKFLDVLKTCHTLGYGKVNDIATYGLVSGNTFTQADYNFMKSLTNAEVEITE